MEMELLDRQTSVMTLATQYAEGVIAALPKVESEQQLYEGLAAAFLSFWEDVRVLGGAL